MTEWLHLRTTPDANGNPRRLYVELEPGGVTFRSIVDEGYEGRAAALRAGMPESYEPVDLHITPNEYRLLKGMIDYGGK